MDNTSKEKIISIDELYGAYREASSDELIVDVRPIADKRSVQIEGALHIPVDDILAAALPMVDRLKKHKYVYLVCQDGQVSKQAFDELIAAGAGNIFYAGIGGINEWIKKNYPTISKEAAADKSKEAEWVLDYKRIEKKAWLDESLSKKLEPLTAITIEGSSIVWNKETKECLVLCPDKNNVEFIYEQMARKGLHCSYVFGHDDIVPLFAEKAFAVVVDRTIENVLGTGKQLVVTGSSAAKGIELMGCRW